jgi:hypothetical protein
MQYRNRNRTNVLPFSINESNVMSIDLNNFLNLESQEKKEPIFSIHENDCKKNDPINEVILPKPNQLPVVSFAPLPVLIERNETKININTNINNQEQKKISEKVLNQKNDVYKRKSMNNLQAKKNKTKKENVSNNISIIGGLKKKNFNIGKDENV